MKNQKCPFTLEESNRILEMAMVLIGQRFPYLDKDPQQSLAGDVYVHLSESTNYEICQNPAYDVIGSAINRTAIKSGIIRDKNKAHIQLEKKTDRTEEEDKKLKALRVGRRIRENSLEEMIEVSGYDKRFGITEDAETLYLKADGIRRIRRAVAGRPFAEKAVELVLEGYEFSEVAEMLGVSYRTLFHNLDGTGNSPLPVVLNKLSSEPAVEVKTADVPVVEVSFPAVVEAPPVDFKFYYVPVGRKKKEEQGVLDFGFLYAPKQDYNSMYAGRI